MSMNYDLFVSTALCWWQHRTSCIIMLLSTTVMCKFHEKKWKLHAPNWRKLWQKEIFFASWTQFFSANFFSFSSYFFFLWKQNHTRFSFYYSFSILHKKKWHSVSIVICWNVNKIASSDNETSSTINRFLICFSPGKTFFKSFSALLCCTFNNHPLNFRFFIFFFVCLLKNNKYHNFSFSFFWSNHVFWYRRCWFLSEVQVVLRWKINVWHSKIIVSDFSFCFIVQWNRSS